MEVSDLNNITAALDVNGGSSNSSSVVEKNSSSLSSSFLAPQLPQPQAPLNNNNNNNKSSSSFKIEIPHISSRGDLHAQQLHTHAVELEQIGFICNAPGSKKDLNKLNIKIKTVELEECVKRAKKFAMEQSVRFALVKQQQQQQKQQLDLIRKQQALLLMCRIYVGSIFYEVKEETVRSSFTPFGPIRSISMSWDATTNKHKGFAFIEFETPEAAHMALDQMNGILLGGRNIKVGRPSNMPQAQPIIDQLTEDAKNYNRIYVASIHPNLNEQDVQSVFEAFGTIKTCSLARDPQTGKHKGYGFIEYETAQAAQDAITSLNLFDLGGQFLRVGRAVTPPENVITGAVPPALPGGGVAANPAVVTAVNSAIGAVLPGQDILNNNSPTAQSIAKIAQLPINPLLNPAAAAAAAALNASVPTAPPQVLLQQPAATTVTAAVTQVAPLSIDTTAVKSNGVNNKPQQQIAVSNSSPNPLATAQQAANNLAASINSGGSGSTNNIELTENQKKLLGMTSADDPSASLEQQVDITLKNKEQRLLLMQKLMQRKPESRVLVLRNMVGPDDVDEELESEITDECEKYGQVERVVIYQEKQDESDDAEIIVKIFVEFTVSKSVDKAVEALNGRFFAGRVVKAEIYDQTSYNAKDYSG